jgi:hypothetical protein
VNRQTAEVIRALTAVTKHVPQVTTELLAGSLTVARQQEFADLLAALAEILHEHADDRDRGVIALPQSGSTAGEEPGGTNLTEAVDDIFRLDGDQPES